MVNSDSQGRDNGAKRVILHALLKRQILVRNKAMVGLGVGILDRTINPSVSNLVRSPGVMLGAGGCVGVEKRKIHALDGARALPFLSGSPRLLRMISSRFADCPVHLMADAGDFFDFMRRVHILLPFGAVVE